MQPSFALQHLRFSQRAAPTGDRRAQLGGAELAKKQADFRLLEVSLKAEVNRWKTFRSEVQSYESRNHSARVQHQEKVDATLKTAVDEHCSLYAPLAALTDEKQARAIVAERCRLPLAPSPCLFPLPSLRCRPLPSLPSTIELHVCSTDTPFH